MVADDLACFSLVRLLVMGGLQGCVSDTEPRSSPLQRDSPRQRLSPFLCSGHGFVGSRGGGKAH